MSRESVSKSGSLSTSVRPLTITLGYSVGVKGANNTRSTLRLMTDWWCTGFLSWWTRLLFVSIGAVALWVSHTPIAHGAPSDFKMQAMSPSGSSGRAVKRPTAAPTPTNCVGTLHLLHVSPVHQQVAGVQLGRVERPPELLNGSTSPRSAALPHRITVRGSSWLPAGGHGRAARVATQLPRGSTPPLPPLRSTRQPLLHPFPRLQRRTARRCRVAAITGVCNSSASQPTPTAVRGGGRCPRSCASPEVCGVCLARPPRARLCDRAADAALRLFSHPGVGARYNGMCGTQAGFPRLSPPPQTPSSSARPSALFFSHPRSRRWRPSLPRWPHPASSARPTKLSPLWT